MTESHQSPVFRSRLNMWKSLVVDCPCRLPVGGLLRRPVTLDQTRCQVRLSRGPIGANLAVPGVQCRDGVVQIRELFPDFVAAHQNQTEVTLPVPPSRRSVAGDRQCVPVCRCGSEPPLGLTLRNGSAAYYPVRTDTSPRTPIPLLRS